MKFKESKLKGAFEIELEPKGDNRGFFMRVYDEKIFKENGLNREWVQENYSFSKEKDTIRGLHFQYPPNAEAKLVKIMEGEVFFAYVDLRKNSATFGKWDSVLLSKENHKMVFIPEGFALGMCTLTTNCVLYYKMGNYYAPENSDTIHWNDSDLGIVWPTKIPSNISEKDSKAKSFKEFCEQKGAINI